MKEQERLNVRIDNEEDMSADLMKVYEAVRNGKMTSRESQDLCNIAGKVLAQKKAKLSYLQWLKEKKRIPYFEDNQPIITSESNDRPE